MKVAILYICTGKYVVFWKDFYVSCEQYFLPGFQKHYFVFTDAETVFGETENKQINKIFQQRMGWPYDTLLRFRLFSSLRSKLASFDYIFFFNANAQVLKPVTPDDILPNKQEKLVVVLHPGYYNKKPSEFTYESKQRKSTAYIKKGNGRYYFAGYFNGGVAKDYLQLIHDLEKNIDQDLSKEIVAVWHDESHLNNYMLNRSPKILTPSFIYPEGWSLPYEPVILIRDKAKHGGHAFLRDITPKKSFKKRIAGLVKKFIGK